MALPTDIKPPQLTPIDLQGLLDKPMPTLTSARPVSIQYSPTSPPQFMADRQEVAPGLFGRAGLLNIAPQVDRIQSTMPQDYIQEYADLERAFQESYAARPEYFNRQYAVGQFIPGIPELETPIEQPSLDTTPLVLAGLASTEYGQELIDKGLDEVFQPADDIRDFVDQQIIESRPVQAVEDVVQQGLSEVKDFAQDIYQSEPVQEFRTGIENLSDTITYPVKALADEIQNIIPEGTGTKIQEAKDDFIKVASDKLGIEGDFLPNLERKFEKVGEAAGAVGDVALGLQAPSYNNMIKAIDAVEKLNMLARGQEYKKVADYTPKPIETPYGTLEFEPVQAEAIVGDTGYTPQVPELEDAEPLIPENIQKGLLSAASAYDVAQFAKDPSIEGAPSAYVSTSYLSEEFAKKPLPGVDTFYVQGPLAAASVYGGLKALEGGIESPAEMAAVANAVPASALLASYGADFLAGGVGAIGTKTGLGSTGLSNFANAAMGPIAIASLAVVAEDLMEGGAAGRFPRTQQTIGLIDGGFGVTDKQSFDIGRYDYTNTQAENAVDFANYMVNNLGYEIDQQAYKDFEASDKDTIVDEYGYFTQKHSMKEPSHNAAAFVASLLEEGVLKPTEDTPLNFNINEAIQILNPSISAYSPIEERTPLQNVNVDYFLSQASGLPYERPRSEIDMLIEELGLETTREDDPRTRAREDSPFYNFSFGPIA